MIEVLAFVFSFSYLRPPSDWRLFEVFFPNTHLSPFNSLRHVIFRKTTTIYFFWTDSIFLLDFPTLSFSSTLMHFAFPIFLFESASLYRHSPSFESRVIRQFSHSPYLQPELSVLTICILSTFIIRRHDDTVKRTSLPPTFSIAWKRISSNDQQPVGF